MARKGNRKVKTGCLTCKIRKIKCDEVKPHCSKCTSTGRACDGYAPTKTHGLQPSGLLDAPSYPKNEIRALEFFHLVVGPSLSGEFEDDFWTRLVLQLGHREPAVRHALVAISSLYEHGAQHSFFLRHYNTAIRKITTSSDESLVLFMSVLFVCLEFLQGNASAAKDHCRHGILVLNTAESILPSTRKHLLQLYSRLSVFPFFFGGDIVTFPQLKGLGTLAERSFSSFLEAQSSLHAIVLPSIRFMRATSKYRTGTKRQFDIPNSYFAEQQLLQQALETWWCAFSTFKMLRKHSDNCFRQTAMLEIAYLVAKIWANTALNQYEVVFDNHLDNFRSIVRLASQTLETGEEIHVKSSPPKFIFETGFLPLLFFVVLKCRYLEIRLAALSCMKVLAADQEGLWDAKTMYCVGQNVIKEEHKIDFIDQHYRQSSLPSEESRIRENMLSPNIEIQYSEGSQAVFRRRITYIFWKAPDELYTRNEWITIHS